MERPADQDLMDRLQAALPQPQPADTAGRILDVMRRMCRAAKAAAFRERGGMLRWVAGERLPDPAMRAIKGALRLDRGGVHASSIWISEPGAPEGWARSWVMWTSRPHDAERDVVYMEGPLLRPVAECTGRLERLTALLGELP